MKFLQAFIFFFPAFLHAQSEKAGNAFGERFMLGVHYGYTEDYIGDRNSHSEWNHFSGVRAGISVNKFLYAGIQSRFIRAGNFEVPASNFYMAGVFGRVYFLHPVMPGSSKRIGVFLESGFMMGNYAFENRNSFEYYYERPGSWYIPTVFGLECRVWKGLTLEGGMHLYYNNGSNWDQQGIAYISGGINWHF